MVDRMVMWSFEYLLLHYCNAPEHPVLHFSTSGFIDITALSLLKQRYLQGWDNIANTPLSVVIPIFPSDESLGIFRMIFHWKRKYLTQSIISNEFSPMAPSPMCRYIFIKTICVFYRFLKTVYLLCKIINSRKVFYIITCRAGLTSFVREGKCKISKLKKYYREL